MGPERLSSWQPGLSSRSGQLPASQSTKWQAGWKGSLDFYLFAAKTRRALNQSGGLLRRHSNSASGIPGSRPISLTRRVQRKRDGL